MRLFALLAAMAIWSCGRLSFDPRSDAAGDGDRDATAAGRSIQLPSGGQMDQVVVAGDGTWYALSNSAGAFRSSDQGASWTRCAARIGSSIAVASDNTVWMSGLDVARSSDHCATWTETGNPVFSSMVFADGATMYAACSNGLRKLVGSTWTSVPTPIDGVGFNWIAKGPTHYFIGTQNYILTSPDAVTWTQVSAGIPSNGVLQVTAGATHTYGITNGGPGGIVCSDASGAVWSTCVGNGGFSIAVDPTNDQRVFAGIYDEGAETTNAFGSTTLGFREKSMDAALVTGLTFLPDGQLILSSDRGVFVAPAGSDLFSPRMTGLDAWEIDAIAIDGGDMYLATRGGPLHSAAMGPFESTTMGIAINTNTYAIGVAPSGEVFSAGRSLYISHDRGDTYATAYLPGNGDGYRIHSIIFDGATAYVGTSTRILTSDPPYTTWVTHALDVGAREVDALLVTPGLLFAGTPTGLYVSPAGAYTFTLVANIAASSVHAMVSLADGRIFAGTSSGMWQRDSADMTGTTWNPVGLVGQPVAGVTVVGTTLIAATTNDVEYSKDGTTWAPVPGLDTTPAGATVFDDTTGQLIVGTKSRGLIRVPMP